MARLAPGGPCHMTSTPTTLRRADHLNAGAWSSFLAAPVAMNRRRADLGTQLTIYGTNRPDWRAV